MGCACMVADGALVGVGLLFGCVLRSRPATRVNCRTPVDMTSSSLRYRLHTQHCGRFKSRVCCCTHGIVIIGKHVRSALCNRSMGCARRRGFFPPTRCTHTPTVHRDLFQSSKFRPPKPSVRGLPYRFSVLSTLYRRDTLPRRPAPSGRRKRFGPSFSKGPHVPRKHEPESSSKQFKKFLSSAPCQQHRVSIPEFRDCHRRMRSICTR